MFDLFSNLTEELSEQFSTFLLECPAALVQILVWCMHRSWLNFGLIPLSVLFCLAVRESCVGIASGSTIAHVARFIGQFPHSYFDAVEPEAYGVFLTPRMAAARYRGIFNPRVERKMSSGMSGIKLNLHIVRPRNGDRHSDKIPAYGTLLGTSFIFLRETPRKITAFGKYQMLHELGHTTKRGASSMYRRMAAYTWLLNAAWIFVLAQRSTQAMAALAVIFLAQMVFRRGWNLWPGFAASASLQSEIEADRYALQGMTPLELQKLRNHITEAPRLDARLADCSPDCGNTYRNFTLHREIETALQEGACQERPQEIGWPSDVFWRSLLTIVAVALVGQHPTAHNAKLLGLATALLTLLAFVALRMANAMRIAVERVLASRATPSPQVVLESAA